MAQEIAPDNQCALILGKPGQQPAERQPPIHRLHRVDAQHVHQPQFPVAAHRLVQRAHPALAVHGQHHVLGGHVQRGRDLVHRGLSRVGFGVCIGIIQHPARPFVDGPGYMDGAVVPQVAADLAHDHRHGIGGKAHGIIRVKAIDGLQQAQTAVLKQVVILRSAAREALHDVFDQRDVLPHQGIPGFGIAVSGADQLFTGALVGLLAQARRGSI